jgi:hypothetical protein
VWVLLVRFIDSVEGALLSTWFSLDFAMLDSSTTWIARLCFAKTKKNNILWLGAN